MREESKLFLAYETAHVPLAKAHVGPVVALDQEVWALLAKEGVEAIALTDISTSPDGDRELLERTRAMARDWYSKPQMSFLSHDGILLGEQYEVAVLYYIQTLHYYVSVLSQALAHFASIEEVVIPQTHVRVPKTADPTAKHKEELPVDVMQLLCQLKNIACIVISAPGVLPGRAARRAIEQVVVGVVVWVVNTFITYTTKARKIHLFSSDPWYRIAPFVKAMPDVDLVMSRRAEFREMGLVEAWRARTRFHHRLDFKNRDIQVLAQEAARRIRSEWEAVRDTLSLKDAYVCGDISYWPIARRMFDTIVCERLEEDISTIESTKRLFKHYGISCVLLFASTKGYNIVLSRVAERIGIPSIELQHALSTTEPTLVHSRLNSRYLASYGPFTNRIYESWGVEPWRLKSCGSPRFDTYTHADPDAVRALRKSLGIKEEGLSVLCNVPQEYLTLEHGNYTSWQVEEYIDDLAYAAAVTPAQFLLRPKPGVLPLSLRAMPNARFADGLVVQQEPLKLLLGLCDIVVSGNSTLVLEALLAHKPVLMYLPHLLDRDFDTFEAEGAIVLVRTKDELRHKLQELVADPVARAALVTRADQFVCKNFCIDGASAARTAALLREVALHDDAKN